MTLPRFSLRDSLWLVLVFALSIGWWIDRGPGLFNPTPVDRSWSAIDVTVEHQFASNSFTYRIHGNWPQGSSDLWLRGNLWMQSKNQPEIQMISVDDKLTDLSRYDLGGPAGSGTLNGFAKQPEPTGFVFDYEIWKGKPGSGKLLTKQSVFSTPMKGDLY